MIHLRCSSLSLPSASLFIQLLRGKQHLVLCAHTHTDHVLDYCLGEYKASLFIQLLRDYCLGFYRLWAFSLLRNRRSIHLDPPLSALLLQCLLVILLPCFTVKSLHLLRASGFCPHIQSPCRLPRLPLRVLVATLSFPLGLIPLG
jgi:hypothetical protein